MDNSDPWAPYFGGGAKRETRGWTVTVAPAIDDPETWVVWVTTTRSSRSAALAAADALLEHGAPD